MRGVSAHNEAVALVAVQIVLKTLNGLFYLATATIIKRDESSVCLVSYPSLWCVLSRASSVKSVPSDGALLCSRRCAPIFTDNQWPRCAFASSTRLWSSLTALLSLSNSPSPSRPDRNSTVRTHIGC